MSETAADERMKPGTSGEGRVVSASAEINAPADAIFTLIATPDRQADWDGNDNVAEAPAGQRVRQIGDVFTARLTTGATRKNRIVEFEEGRLIAWLPGEVGAKPFGQLWRWELEPMGGATRVTHTYDWLGLPEDAEPRRIRRARATTEDSLAASINRLKVLAESE